MLLTTQTLLFPVLSLKLRQQETKLTPYTIVQLQVYQISNQCLPSCTLFARVTLTKVMTKRRKLHPWRRASHHGNNTLSIIIYSFPSNKHHQNRQ